MLRRAWRRPASGSEGNKERATRPGGGALADRKERLVYRTEYYAVYLIACGLLIAGLAIVLHWAGDVFLHDAFRGKPELARAVARLLDIGFYLVSVGYVAMTTHSWIDFNSRVDVADAIATKVGFFLLLLGLLHVFNILILAVFRGRRDAVPAPAVS
jgi:hypothetical protein